jgi:AcrR family transcriptional regulator
MNQRERQKLETRRKIFESAFSLFRKRSFDTVKITDIVKLADVSVGAFYYHYPTKETLIDEGYREFDEKLEKAWRIDEPKPGVETIKYLIKVQLKDVQDKGYEITGIFFKNQVGTSNTYLFTKGRFLYKKLYENVKLVNKKDYSDDEITDSILRVSRGAIYDWCLHKGNFDIIKTGLQGLEMVLSYYKTI